MSRVSEDSLAPRHRAAPVRPGAEGAVATGLVWKVCAVLPIVLLCVLMSVKIAGNIGGDDTKESSQTQEPGADVTDSFAPLPSDTPSVDGKKDPRSEEEKLREIMSGVPDPFNFPDGLDPFEDVNDPGFTLEPGDFDQTVTPVPAPTKKPTKKPTPSPSSPAPSPTPTPGEAREQCLSEGISALDVAALAACIADLMDPSN